MINRNSSTPRWYNYFLRHGSEFDSFWQKYLNYNSRDILFILAKGFDPRMCCGVEAISEVGGSGKRDCMIIDFDEGASSPSKKYGPLVDKNMMLLSTIFPQSKKLQKNVQMISPEGRRVGSRNIANTITGIEEFVGYSDIVVDISSMPRAIYFPLIGSILSIIDTAPVEKSTKPNLHLIVSENAGLDSRIKDQGIDDDASYLYGFTGSLGMESFSHSPKIWIPLLGEKQQRQLEKIHNLILPNEICPVLPIPAVNPRRTDDLLVEYRKLLFDGWGVDHRNFIFAAEQNPFELYRAIHRTVVRYNESLRALGGCQVIISALSSKLLSIGALLAAYELKDYGLGVGMAHVETQGYEIEGEIGLGNELYRTELSTLWLAGDCYVQ